MSRRRLVLLAVGAVTSIVAVAGVWYWDATRFPAAEQRLAGTPFTLPPERIAEILLRHGNELLPE